MDPRFTRMLQLILSLLLFSVCGVSAGAATGDEVDRAIGRMRRYLLGRQHPIHGSWEARFANAQNAGGETALVTLALLKGGLPAQDPYVAKAIDYLIRTPMVGSFAVSTRAQVWASLPEDYRSNLQADVQWLVESGDREKTFTFALSPGAPGNVGESSALINAQYTLFGLGEAAIRDCELPIPVWQSRLDLLLRTQNPDGGWGYLANDNASYGSMSVGGLAGLLTARRQILSRQNLTNPQLAAAIDRAWGWIDSRFAGGREPGTSDGWSYYYLWTIERAGLAGGIRNLNGEDWYQSGLNHIMAQQGADGGVNGNNIDTAFSLLFLSRGKMPVCLARVVLQPGERYDAYPNVAGQFARYLSDLRESELNWVQIDASDPGDTWLVSPMAIMACDAPARLTDRQRSSLKRYLDLGGTVVIHPVRQVGGFDEAMRSLSTQLYPNFKSRSLPEDHTVFHVLNQVPPSGRRGVSGLSNGVRELLIWTDRDIFGSMQSNIPSLTQEDWCLMTNLWALTSGRGTWPERLLPVFEPRVKADAIGTATIARVSLARHAPDSASVPAEPGAWDAYSSWLFNRSRIDLVPTSVELEQLTPSTPLAHLAGTDPVEFREAEFQAIERYVAAGGTLLVESVGGRGSFTAHVEQALASRFAGFSEKLPASHPLVCGQGLRGGHDLRYSPMTPAARLDLLIYPTPQLRSININGRSAVIFSDLDLSLGMMGVRHWGVRGYASETARRLITNIVLSANPRLSPAPPLLTRSTSPENSKATNPLSSASISAGTNTLPATQPSAAIARELETLLSQSKSAQKQERWDEAVRLLERANALKPSAELNSQISTIKSRLAFEQGQRRLAAKDWEGAQKAFNVSIELRDNPDARKGLEKVEAIRPKDPDVIRGLAALKEGDYEAAATALQIAVDSGANSDIQGKLRLARRMLLVRRGKALLTKRDYTSARDIFAEAQELDPIDAEAAAGALEARRGLEYNEALQVGDELMAEKQYGPAKEKFHRARQLMNSPEVQKRIDESDYQLMLIEVRKFASLQDWAQVRSILPNLAKLRQSDELRQIEAQLREYDAGQKSTTTPANKSARE